MKASDGYFIVSQWILKFDGDMTAEQQRLFDAAMAMLERAGFSWELLDEHEARYPTEEEIADYQAKKEDDSEEEDDSEVVEILDRIRARGEQKQPEPVQQQPVQVEKTPRTQKEQFGLLFSW